MPIALLNFPSDLLGDVLKQCDPFELYCLSKCSKKVRNSVKLGGTRNWKISYCDYWDTIIKCGDGSNYYFCPTVEPEEYFKIDNSNKRMYIDIPFEGNPDFFFYLLEIFGIRGVELLGFHEGTFDTVLSIVKVLIERKTEIETFAIGEVSRTEIVAQFMPLLAQMNITNGFHCCSKFPPDYHYHFAKYPNQLFIAFSSWFNIGQLLDCTCVRIELWRSMLGNQELDVFLQHWKKKGTFPNLRFLRVKGNKIVNKSPILGMIPPIQNVDNPRVEVTLGPPEPDVIVNPVRVTKDDGTEGWLKVGLGFYPELTLLVSNPST
ncbi:unnamed protein product [Caenorhabditis nigoni]